MTATDIIVKIGLGALAIVIVFIAGCYGIVATAGEILKGNLKKEGKRWVYEKK